MSPHHRPRGLVTPPVDTLVDSDSSSDEIDADPNSADALHLHQGRLGPNSTRSSVCRYDACYFSSEAGQLPFSERNPGQETLSLENGTQIEAKAQEQADLEQSPTDHYQERGERGQHSQGMMLRSGSQLKGVRRFLRTHHSRRRQRSLCVLNLSSANTSNNALEDPQTPQGHGTPLRSHRRMQGSGLSSPRISTAVVSLSARSRQPDNPNANNNARRARRPSPYKTKAGRRNVSGWRDTYDDDEEEEEEEDDQDYDRGYKPKRRYRVKDTYEVDPADDYSDTDSFSYTSSFTSADGLSASLGRRKKRASWTPNVAVFWKAFTRLMLAVCNKNKLAGSTLGRYSLLPLCRLLSFLSFFLWSQVKKVVRFFLWMDTWMVSRNTRRNCCLCLPMLLLPPLLLAGSYHLYGGRLPPIGLLSLPSFFASQKPPVPPFSDADRQTINLYHEVKQILYQLQAEHQDWLNRADVESLVRSMLTPEMESLKVSLLNMAKEGSSDQTALKISQHDARQRLLALEEHMASLVAKAKILDGDMADTKSLFMGTLNGDRDKQAADMASVRASLTSLKGKIESLSSEFNGLTSFAKTCCLDEPSLMSMIQEQVNKKMAKLVSEDKAEQGGIGTDFTRWLNKYYVDHDELEEQMRTLTQDITERIKLNKGKSSDISSSFLLGGGGGGNGAGVPEDAVRLIVEDALLKYSADRTGLPDYALESAGGSVLNSRCSETYAKKTAVLSVFGIPLFYLSNSPRSVIQPDVHPGQCWAFKGDKGHVAIQLAVPIRPTGFSMEHIPRSLSIHGNIDSAPKDFTVIGLKSEADRVGVSLGNYTYQSLGTPIQHFDLQLRNPGVFAFVELRILNNHGDKEYTCIYRFRVHGVPQS